MKKTLVASLALLSFHAACAAQPAAVQTAEAPKGDEPAPSAEPPPPESEPTAPTPPSGSGSGWDPAEYPGLTCFTDSDCADGEACRFYIDYGDCLECEGGPMASACDVASAVSCPDNVGCGQTPTPPMCSDDKFKLRCPHTVFES